MILFMFIYVLLWHRVFYLISNNDSNSCCFLTLQNTQSLDLDCQNKRQSNLSTLETRIRLLERELNTRDSKIQGLKATIIAQNNNQTENMALKRTLEESQTLVNTLEKTMKEKDMKFETLNAAFMTLLDVHSALKVTHDDYVRPHVKQGFSIAENHLKMILEVSDNAIADIISTTGGDNVGDVTEMTPAQPIDEVGLYIEIHVFISSCV